MTTRRDVYVYNESTGLVLTSQKLKRRKPFNAGSAAWKKAVAEGLILAVELAQDDPVVVRVVVDDDLTDQENAEWVDQMTAKLCLPTTGLALCGGVDYVEDPTNDDNECVQFLAVQAESYLAELYTYFNSPNGRDRNHSRPDPADPGQGCYVDFLLRLTPWKEGSPCTLTDKQGWITCRPPTRRLQSAPRGIIAVAPVGWMPSEPEADPPVAPGRSKIRILSIPPGDAPESVRRAWVGLELPIAPDSPGNRCLVYSNEAIAVLALADPTAAQWWRDHHPKACRALGLTFEFSPTVYERLD